MNNLIPPPPPGPLMPPGPPILPPQAGGYNPYDAQVRLMCVQGAPQCAFSSGSGSLTQGVCFLAFNLQLLGYSRFLRHKVSGRNASALEAARGNVKAQQSETKG
eukprot:1155704-Pelagomonas_calceolata.AAC.1